MALGALPLQGGLLLFVLLLEGCLCLFSLLFQCLDAVEELPAVQVQRILFPAVFIPHQGSVFFYAHDVVEIIEYRNKIRPGRQLFL